MTGYIGRFAPSPTGPLHMGSLVAALASYLDARQANGKWLLRIEDLDPPRESPTAPDEIKAQLTSHGLHWDGELYQGTRDAAYQRALATLGSQGRLFCCTCTRKQTPPVYPGTCRGTASSTEPHSLRFQVEDQRVDLHDRLQGMCSWQLRDDVGDFIVRRKDGLIAYQLAVVVDDDFQGVTDVVRGIDLLESTPRQLSLIDALGYSTPRYLHIPVLVDARGEKLSKQAHARPVSNDSAMENLKRALTILGQPNPAETTSVDRLLSEATARWDINRIPATNAVSGI